MSRSLLYAVPIHATRRKGNFSFLKLWVLFHFRFYCCQSQDDHRKRIVLVLSISSKNSPTLCLWVILVLPRRTVRSSIYEVPQVWAQLLLGGVPVFVQPTGLSIAVPVHRAPGKPATHMRN